MIALVGEVLGGDADGGNEFRLIFDELKNQLLKIISAERGEEAVDRGTCFDRFGFINTGETNGDDMLAPATPIVGTSAGSRFNARAIEGEADVIGEGCAACDLAVNAIDFGELGAIGAVDEPADKTGVVVALPSVPGGFVGIFAQGGLDEFGGGERHGAISEGGVLAGFSLINLRDGGNKFFERQGDPALFWFTSRDRLPLTPHLPASFVLKCIVKGCAKTEHF